MRRARTPDLSDRPMSSPQKTQPPVDPDRAMRPLPRLMFMSRWLQVPLYLGLVLAQCVYVFTSGSS